MRPNQYVQAFSMIYYTGNIHVLYISDANLHFSPKQESSLDCWIYRVGEAHVLTVLYLGLWISQELLAVAPSSSFLLGSCPYQYKEQCYVPVSKGID